MGKIDIEYSHILLITIIFKQCLQTHTSSFSLPSPPTFSPSHSPFIPQSGGDLPYFKFYNFASSIQVLFVI